jgi:hypothetical protein
LIGSAVPVSREDEHVHGVSATHLHWDLVGSVLQPSKAERGAWDIPLIKRQDDAVHPGED